MFRLNVRFNQLKQIYFKNIRKFNKKVVLKTKGVQLKKIIFKKKLIVIIYLIYLRMEFLVNTI